MATETAYALAQGSAAGARFNASQNSALTVNGNTTVTGPIALPKGCILHAVAIETPVAISGTPTTCNVSVGTTSGGVDIVAAVDCKAQAHVAATIVAAFDKILGLAAIDTIFIQVVTAGGTASAGTINVLVSYSPPAR